MPINVNVQVMEQLCVYIQLDNVFVLQIGMEIPVNSIVPLVMWTMFVIPALSIQMFAFVQAIKWFVTISKVCIIQGVSFWNGLYKLALTDKNMQVKLGLKMVLECWDREFLGTTIIFQKSGIGWPQQPLTEKVLKFNLIFHDSTPKKYFFKTSK